MTTKPKLQIVVKLGTRIVNEDGHLLALPRVAGIVKNICDLWKKGHKIILVSSGSIGLGRTKLKINGNSLSLSQKQACAAVGQSQLMKSYETLFSHYQQLVGQVLVTADDLSSRTRYLNLRETLSSLISFGVVPIINENDSIATNEIQRAAGKSFGDNDKLSALVASKVGADLLIILTDVDGFYSENPKTNSDAVKIERLRSQEDLSQIHAGEISEGGRGGVQSKLEAVRIASVNGIKSVVASGFIDNVLLNTVTSLEKSEQSQHGTTIFPIGKISKRKAWIGFSSGSQGSVKINEGAKCALESSFASLLPIGITDVDGDFEPGDVIRVTDDEGNEVARGISYFSAKDVRTIAGKSSKEVKILLPESENNVVIQRDHLVVFKEHNQ